jgi:hypothetical protein
MTSVPKPLKFLRPQYEALKAAYEQLGDAGNKKLLADVLSLLAMTRAHTAQDTLPDSLRFRLLGSDDEIGSFGHEVRACSPLPPGLVRTLPPRPVATHGAPPALPLPRLRVPDTLPAQYVRNLAGEIAREYNHRVDVSGECSPS